MRFLINFVNETCTEGRGVTVSVAGGGDPSNAVDMIFNTKLRM